MPPGCPALRLLLCLFLAVSFAPLPSSSNNLDSRQINALTKLKEDFLHPSSLYSWSAAAPPCIAWVGVSCDNTTARVINLSLPRSGFPFGARISASIGDLQYLQSLDLSGNAIAGSVPQEISRLRHLSFLDLSNNLLTGAIPSSPWRNLTQLRHLYLHGNRLTGTIPPELADASAIEYLRLERNNLTGAIPSTLLSDRVPRLRYFSVEHNGLNGSVPVTIGVALRLRSLYFSDNQLSGSLPAQGMANLTRLRNFAADGNRLSGPLPPAFSYRRLTTFNVSYNNFSGQIPPNSATNWTAAAFLGNPLLCGFPLPNDCRDNSITQPPTPSPSVVTKTINSGGDSGEGRRRSPPSKLIAAVVGGLCAASIVVVVLVIVLHRRRRFQAANEEAGGARVPEALNWFSSEIQARRMHDRLEVFRRSFKGYSYEEMVAGAGHFDTAHVLGKGRFSTVYRSQLNGATAVMVAIKVLKNNDLPPDFEKELDLLAPLQHKNLLCIRGFYTNPLEKAILLDYQAAGTLYDLLHGRRTGGTVLDWSARHKIALGVAQAMVYLHGRRVLHRDLKSTNVLLEEDLVPKVADYGLVHLICGRRGSGDAAVVETPGYTAPEVPGSKRYTEKSDVYSYGVVLLELITGRKVEPGMVQWARRQGGAVEALAEAAVLRSFAWPEYIEKAVELALRCVDEKAEERPSMAAAASILEGLLPVLSPLRSPVFTEASDDEGTGRRP